MVLNVFPFFQYPKWWKISSWSAILTLLIFVGISLSHINWWKVNLSEYKSSGWEIPSLANTPPSPRSTGLESFWSKVFYSWYFFPQNIWEYVINVALISNNNKMLLEGVMAPISCRSATLKRFPFGIKPLTLPDFHIFHAFI